MAKLLLTKNFNTGTWQEGCGCGGKKKIDHPLLPNTKEIFLHITGHAVGPVTGIKYETYPNTTSLNIDEQDADAWLASGEAVPPILGWKGYKTRES